jgi:spore coat protein U-like protein
MRVLVRIVSVSAAVLLVLAAAPAFAATATSSFTVTATVENTCTISTAGIAFGVYDPIVTHAAAPLDAAGSVTITCTRGATTTIGLNSGNNGPSAVGTTRAMAAGANYLSYEIYQEAAHSTVWGNSGAGLYTPAAAPSSAARVFTTYGRIPAGQDVPSGSYSDTVLATVTF